MDLFAHHHHHTDWMAWATVICTVATAFLAGLAVVVAWRQLRKAATANGLSATAELFGEYRSAEMQSSRHVLNDGLEEYKGRGVSDLPPPLKDAAMKVGQYLDHLGALVVLELVDIDTVSGFLGLSALKQWDDLGSHVYTERLTRNKYYLRHFEDLAARLAAHGPEQKIKKLKMLQPDSWVPGTSTEMTGDYGADD